MNHTQQACDAERLEAYLHGLLDEQLEHEVETHIDSCESCRYRMEQYAAEPASWEEATDLLGDPRWRQDEYQTALSNRGADDSHNNHRLIQSVIESLAPTDDPAMLGRIDGYEISGVIGCGGMGAVLKGFDRSLNRIVAIKVLSPHLASSGAARLRFAREAQAAAAMTHVNVIDIYGVSEANGLPYLVMPYARGPSLQKRIDDRGPLPVVEVLRIGSQIAAGLAAAHAQGLVHRDIKPANILLNDGVERLVITDFGLARAVDDSSLTRTGVIAGTPQYMSPEQARGETVDCRSDLFSLGSVMYTLCVGRPPFRAESAYGILRRISDNDPRPIRETNPDIPEWLCRIVDKLMAKRPDERFASAEEVAELLRDCLAHVQQPTTESLPSSVEQLSQSPPQAACKQNQLGQQFNIPKRMVIAAAFAFSLIFAGVLIVLEMSKAKLTIECVADDVPIRIMQGDEVVKRLTVSKSGKTIRVAAGNYQVEIEGNMDGISVDGGIVSLSRGGVETVKIVSSTNTFNTGKAENSLSLAALERLIARTDGEVITSTGSVTIEVPNDSPQVMILRGQKDQVETVERSLEYHMESRQGDKRASDTARQLLDAVREFNQQQQQNPIGKVQPPLTDDEVIASIRWAVMRGGDNESSNPYRQQLRHIVEQRQLPSPWALNVVTEVEGAAGEHFRGWFVRLVYSGTPGVPPYDHAIREQLLWQLDAEGQAIELGEAESGDDDADSKPLAAAIHGFNLSHQQLAGLDMPPLTEQELIAAIRYQKLRRNEFDITDGEFARMQQIADKRRLPADAEISVLTGFQPGDGYRYDIWSVRFSMRKQVNTVPHPFTGFTIREHYVRSHTLDLDKIAWGPVAESGLQAGVRFEPRQTQYSIGQEVTPYFYYRNTGDQKFDISFPNMESGKLVAVDNAGAAIPCDTDKNPKWIVGFMGLGEFGFGSQHEICGRPIILGDVERGDAEFAIRAQAGQAVRVHFVLSNYADRGGSQLQTGEIAFSMAPALEGEPIIGREIRLQSVEAEWVQAVLADFYADQIRDENLSITMGTSPKSVVLRGPAKMVTEVAELIARFDISVRVEPTDREKDPGTAANGASSAWDDRAEFRTFDQDLTTLESRSDPLWDDHPASVPSDILRHANDSREKGN